MAGTSGHAKDGGAAAPPAAPADAHEELTLEQLASVRALLNPDAAATLHDILITASLEALREGPLSEAELVNHARRLWPGTGIDALAGQRGNACGPQRALRRSGSRGRLGEVDVEQTRHDRGAVIPATRPRRSSTRPHNRLTLAIDPDEAARAHRDREVGLLQREDVVHAVPDRTPPAEPCRSKRPGCGRRSFATHTT
jgi:hypothetical protein